MSRAFGSKSEHPIGRYGLALHSLNRARGAGTACWWSIGGRTLVVSVLGSVC